jgi:hypothetical protein
MANISMDDTYAIFAGWDIDHPDVYELQMDVALPHQRSLVQHWLTAIGDRFESVDVILFGVFLEHQAILGRGHKGTESRVFVYDGERFVLEPFPKPGIADPKLTYLLWRGRLFLQMS